MSATSKSVGAATARRRDLQGLRAVAVLLVALNHANVPLLRGGYVGVDVFFVLSGYFITGLLLRDGFGSDDGELGGISLRRFYARRARRILPAACLTLLTVSVAVYVIYDVLGHDLLSTKPVLEDGLAASLFFANTHLAGTTTNYFAQAATTMPSPFQHFWSLSVEEQFYLVWPALLAVTFFLCRGRARGITRRDSDAEPQRRVATWLLGVLIAVGCAGSLIWSIHDTAVDPQAAYFSTMARVWEFGAGAGLALLVTRSHPLSRALRSLLGWVGLGMIAAAALIYSSATSFPGDAALLPVLGAGLVILAGVAPAPHGVDRALGIRPLAYIGDRSYGFYLWHYPVLILAWQAAGHVLPVSINLALLGGAFVLSALIYAFYENPLRFARWLRGWRTAVMAPVALSLSLFAVLLLIAAFDSSLASDAVASDQASVVTLTPARGQPAPTSLWSSTPIPEVGAAAAAARRGAALPHDIVPSLQELERERAHISYGMHRGCQPGFGPGYRDRTCRLGDQSAKRVVAVLGDSHAGMWMSALEADGRRQGFAVVPLDKPGCYLNDIHRNRTGWPCAKWYHWALGEDRKLHPAATIVSFEYARALQAQPATPTRELQSVLGHVTHGVLLSDPPGQTQQPTTCISQPGTNLGRCSSTVPDTYVPLMRSLAKMTARTHHPAIPTLQWFCAKGVCPMVIDHTLTRIDKSHLTVQYSTDLGPVLGDELKPILARLEHG